MKCMYRLIVLIVNGHMNISKILLSWLLEIHLVVLDKSRACAGISWDKFLRHSDQETTPNREEDLFKPLWHLYKNPNACQAKSFRRPEAPTHSQPPRRALATEEELLQAARALAQGREKWCSFPGLSQNLELRCGIIFGIWLCHLLSPVSSEVACSTRPIHDKDFALKKEF